VPETGVTGGGGGFPAGAKRFNAAYLASFRDYIREPCELTLRNAYELGREAVEEGLTVLDMAVAHHDALARTIGADPGDKAVVRAAGDFFLEGLSSFEMVQRGFREERDAAALERRHAEMLRQLSHFLADASLALGASDSKDEMLRLVAEQARELTQADCCLVVPESRVPAPVRAVSYPDGDLRWAAFARWIDVSQVGSVAGTTRLSEDEIQGLRLPREAEQNAPVVRGWLATPMTALDGRTIGSIHLINESDRQFSPLDEAVLVHLAQMSAAALERVRLYASGWS
jgi:hypothetical protein